MPAFRGGRLDPPSHAELLGSARRYRSTISVAAAILVGAAIILHPEGRAWWCPCGHLSLWVGDAWGPETSQQFLDPYSLTHVLHGFLFYGVLALLAKNASVHARFLATVGGEALWEIVENSTYVIQRYRVATAALGYTGDTVLNSLGDILCCAVGFVIARRSGSRWTVVLFVIIEVVLLLWIRDSLLLNVLMLFFPLKAIRRWQLKS